MAFRPWGAVLLGILLLDQASKILVEKLLPLGQSVTLLPFFALTHVQNTGAAFGLFPQSNGVFVGLTLAILGLLLKMHRELAAQGILARLGLALVWGGALGNLGDRLRRGAVTDFLDVYWKGWHWPAFNVADSAITVGVSFLLIQNFFAEKS
ncbi:MAG: signal peptidase II [Elusimicrobia bacterium]|nr:signal peptidase II [Elusimicrobiota bacterium]